METSDGSASSDWTPRRLTHAEARREQLLYWASKSIPERLAAMTALNERMRVMRGETIDEQKPDLTPRRVPRNRD